MILPIMHLKPSGCLTHSSSCITPWRNIVFTSIWWSSSLTSIKENNRSNSHIVGNKYKYVIIVFSLFSRETYNHEPCFIFLNTSISSMLDLVLPLRSHNRLPFGSRNNFPRSVLHNRFILFNHSIFPNLLFHCFFKGVWFSL